MAIDGIAHAVDLTTQEVDNARPNFVVRLRNRNQTSALGGDKDPNAVAEDVEAGNRFFEFETTPNERAMLLGFAGGNAALVAEAIGQVIHQAQGLRPDVREVDSDAVLAQTAALLRFAVQEQMRQQAKTPGIS